MTVCAQSTPEMYQNMNIYRAARIKAGIWSREAAEAKTNINWRTIERIENNKREPKPDEVLSMAHGYKQTELALTYCQHECPIGKQYMTKAESKDLATAVLGILQGLNEIQKHHRDRLIEIASDGIIDEKEQPCVEKIMLALLRTKSSIESLLMCLTTEGLDFRQRNTALRSG